MNAYNDESTNKPLARHIGVWDDRPRFLGMFSSYDVPKGTKQPPLVGVADHLITCRNCAMSRGEVHPALHAICLYVRLGSRIYTVSWPTWARF